MPIKITMSSSWWRQWFLATRKHRVLPWFFFSLHSSISQWNFGPHWIIWTILLLLFAQYLLIYSRRCQEHGNIDIWCLLFLFPLYLSSFFFFFFFHQFLDCKSIELNNVHSSFYMASSSTLPPASLAEQR